MLDHFDDGLAKPGSAPESTPAPSDRRNQQRHVTVLRVAKLHTRYSEELCLVRNISAGGLMALIYSELEIGDRLVTEFKSGRVIPGTIVWRRDGLAGVKFEAPIDAAQLLAGESVLASHQLPLRSPRVNLMLPARIRIGARYQVVTLVNLSQGGAMIRPQEPLEKDQKLVLMVRGLAPIAGTVRWTNDEFAGVAFDIAAPFEVLAPWIASVWDRAPDTDEAA